MTISDPPPRDPVERGCEASSSPSSAAKPTGARSRAKALVPAVVLVALAACGQKGALRLDEGARPAASTPAVVPGSSSRTSPAPRDPFANPSPTELPASVPRP